MEKKRRNQKKNKKTDISTSKFNLLDRVDYYSSLNERGLLLES